MRQSAAQQSLPFVGCTPMNESVKPWVAHPAIREAFDQADRLQSCLDGFAALMSRDPHAIQGQSLDDIETLVTYLNEKHREAINQARDATWRALDASAPTVRQDELVEKIRHCIRNARQPVEASGSTEPAGRESSES